MVCPSGGLRKGGDDLSESDPPPNMRDDERAQM